MPGSFAKLRLSDLNNSRSVVRLTKKQFADALQKGLGRAWLHVKEHGLQAVEDLMLAACLHDLSYDPQCEPDRADWLWQMFGTSPSYPKFRDAILAALLRERKPEDAHQLSRLAKIMAQRGDAQAMQALEQFVFAKARAANGEDWLGAQEWLELKGVEGAIEVAKIYGERLLANPQDRLPEWSFNRAETEQHFYQGIQAAAAGDPRLQAFAGYLEKSKAERKNVNREAWRAQARVEFRKQYPLERILDIAAHITHEHDNALARFGDFASPEELAQVYAALREASSDTLRERLLAVFRRTPLPQLEDEIIEWALTGGSELRDAAITALSQHTDARVHRLAKTLIVRHAPEETSEGVLDLFERNYQAGDAALILRFLESGALGMNQHQLHGHIGAVVTCAENHSDPQFAPLLRWGYEHTPCSSCRYNTAALLEKLGQLDETLLRECAHDVDEDTRELALQFFEANPASF